MLQRTRRSALGAATILVVATILAACAPSPAPGPTTDVVGMIHAAFDPIGRGDEAVRVAQCESGFNPGATNGQYQGVFQLGAHFEGRANAYGGGRYDPWINIQVARDTVAHDGGWGQWACKP